MEPVVKPLSLLRRRLFFGFLFLVFLFALPAFIFYATGYRLDVFSPTPTITATGGLYVVTSDEEASIYVDEEPAPNSRVFRSATYIQGLNAGEHRVHVQAPGAHTWVKELFVQPHIVVEVESFNMPLTPHIRPVTPYATATGTPVVVGSEYPFSFASSSVPVVATTSRATTTLIANREFDRLKALFAEKASTTALRAEYEALLRDNPQFSFATATRATSTARYAAATSTVAAGDLMLYKLGDDVYAKALGQGSEVPVYFCVITRRDAVVASTTELVAPTSSLVAATTSLGDIELRPGDVALQCRTDIRIDRMWQTVKDFTFFPGNENLVLMHLEQGIYVVEIDDRAWQNGQLLYPGSDLTMLVDGGRIFVQDRGHIVEVFTTVAGR